MKRLHPNANPINDFIIEDHGDGPELKEWNLPGKPQTDAEISAAMNLPPPQTLEDRVAALETKSAELEASVAEIATAATAEVVKA